MKVPGLFTALSVLCVAAAAVILLTLPSENTDAASIERKNDMKTDDKGHVLVSLWKEYEAVRSADRPQKEADVLDRIMQQALGRGLTWDYYDAAVKWYASVTSRNWKLQDKSRTRIMDDASELSDPVVDYGLIRAGLLGEAADIEWFRTNVLGRSADLKKNCSRAFYGNDAALVPSSGYAAFITPLISNDYEYLLWSVFRYNSGWRDSEVADAARKELEDYLQGSYPAGVFLEYLSVLDSIGGEDLWNCFRYGKNECGDSLEVMFGRRRSELEAFAAEYEGKAVSLYAEAQMLADRKQYLDMGLSGDYGTFRPGSSDYKTLREDCGRFEKSRTSYKGGEKKVAECVTSVSDLIRDLDAEYVWLYTDEYTVGVVFRNVGKAVLELRKGDRNGDVAHSTVISDDKAGYYLPDTVEYRLPAIPDGDYVLVCRYGKEEAVLQYPVTSLSIAQRSVSGSGSGIYLAWQKSGRPVEKADVEILSKGDTARVVKDFVFDGFTSVQDILDEVSSGHDGALVIRCSFLDDKGFYRRSPELFLSENVVRPHPAAESVGQEAGRSMNARIFKDRAAFNPGDSVQFKVVLYSYSSADGYAVEPGRDIRVWLVDPDGKTMSEMTLDTNAFGSAAGVFDLPDGLKGGTYNIFVNVSGSDGVLARSALTVDEFVLPTYTMEFEENRTVWFSGDTVVVRGRLSSYSGHPVSSARIEYAVESYATGVSPVHGETVAGDDGTFEIRFKAGKTDGDRSYFCYPSVKVTDLTGETYEWTAGPVHVNPEMSIYTHLENEAEGNVDMLPGTVRNNDVGLMSCDTAIVRFSLTYNMPECPVEYEILRDGRSVMSGSAMTGDEEVMDLSGLPSGLYLLKSKAVYTRPDGKSLEAEDETYLLKVSDQDTAMDYGVELFFRKAADGRVSALVGVGDGDQWYVVEVYDAAGELLKLEIIRMDGRNGSEDSVRMIGYDFDNAWTDAVSMRIFGFKNGESRSVSFTYERKKPEEWNLPLEFTRFVDRSLPGTGAVFSLKTLPGVECAVSVYDKSTDNIMDNLWRKIPYRKSGPVYVGIMSVNGSIGRDYYDMVPFQLAGGTNYYGAHPMMRTKAAAVVTNDLVVEESVASDALESAGAGMDVTVRERFDKTLAFLPFLLSDSDGNVEFKVDVTDKLSTYYVSVFAHDSRMRNSVLREEMVVSLPVKLSVVEPRFLYWGDRYCLRASVANSSGERLSGKMTLYVYGSRDYDNSEPLEVRSEPLSVGPGSAAAAEFVTDIPSGTDTVGFKIVYTAEKDGVTVSDAMFVAVPVLEPVQTLTEAHSTLLLPGMDRDSLKRSLEAAFTGVSPYGAAYREVSLLDMLMESVPQKIEPQSKDVLALTEAFYMRRISAAVRKAAGKSGLPGQTVAENEKAADCMDDARLQETISACRNSDGGFGWFEGFPSSPVITAVVLERFASLRDRGLSPGSGDAAVGNAFRTELSDAVAYLDSLQFSVDRPFWYGGISFQQYLHVRSMYPEIPFRGTDDRRQIRKFASKTRDFLLPGKERGLNDNILAKARRAAVLMSLSSPDAESLALSLGLRKKDLKKLGPSAEADILSLSEYAVSHPSGGIYFPNAVMPFRALLESEIYAHTMLCDLMQRYSDWSGSVRESGGRKVRPAVGKSGTTLAEKASGIAEGIRLWLMVQKETQRWDAGPACLNAVASVLDGSESLKSAGLAVMTKKYAKPFGSIGAAGNEMAVERRWYRVVSGLSSETVDSLSVGRERKPLRYGSGTWMFPVSEGDTLQVGDRIVAQYRIWSRENRSFVSLVSPYYAALRPVDQLSGRTGGWFRPMVMSGSGVSGISITPSGYREVKSDRTVYYFDVWPEENISFNEEFFVTQAGVFRAPAVSVECLYSPHYRANGPASAVLRSE